MNRFAEIKTLLKGEEVVVRYLGTPCKKTCKGSWYKSPFRQEKTASFYVSEKGIHDFGSSEHYDIISFVAKYFNTDNFNALKILCKDFGLTLLSENLNKEDIKKIKAERENKRIKKEKITKWFNSKMKEICDEILENEKLIRIFEKTTYFEALSILYDKQAKLEMKFNIMQGTNDLKILYKGG